MEEKEFEHSLMERSKRIDMMLAEAAKHNNTIRAFTENRSLDADLRNDAIEVMSEGLRHKMMQIVVAFEELESYVKDKCSDPEKKISLLYFYGWFKDKVASSCKPNSDLLKEIESILNEKGGK